MLTCGMIVQDIWHDLLCLWLHSLIIRMMSQSFMAYKITNNSTVCSTAHSGLEKESIKAIYYWYLWGKQTYYRWIPLTKGQ